MTALLRLLPFLFCLCAWESGAQASDKELIVKTIQQLFDGMRAGDSALVRAAFLPTARLSTIVLRDSGRAELHEEGGIAGFVKAVGAPRTVRWDERVLSWDIRVDGHMATAWTEYTFYLDDKISHCGVNAFQLFRSAGGWKISSITDTRRKEGCRSDPLQELHAFINAWHRAAATADEEVFFGSMDPDALYIGTDASERWLRDELKSWSKQYFDRASAWDFKPLNRGIFLTDDGQYAWFDETLDTWMGTCRGSGILRRYAGGWKFKQYVLSICVPNDVVKSYLDLVKKQPGK